MRNPYSKRRKTESTISNRFFHHYSTNWPISSGVAKVTSLRANNGVAREVGGRAWTLDGN